MSFEMNDEVIKNLYNFKKSEELSFDDFLENMRVVFLKQFHLEISDETLNLINSGTKEEIFQKFIDHYIKEMES